MLEIVEHIFLQLGGIDILIDVAEDMFGGHGWDRDKSRDNAYKFFEEGIFPTFVLDQDRVLPRTLGHHLRASDRTYEAIKHAEGLVDNHLAIGLRMVHAACHEIPHAFISFCISICREEGAFPACDTPPRLNYPHRHGVQDIGESGLYVDSKIWGGMLFYRDLTTNCGGIPCLFRQENNPENYYMQLSYDQLFRLCFMKYDVTASLPLLLYEGTDGEMLREADGGLPCELRSLQIGSDEKEKSPAAKRPRKKNSKGSAEEHARPAVAKEPTKRSKAQAQIQTPIVETSEEEDAAPEQTASTNGKPKRRKVKSKARRFTRPKKRRAFTE
ncbi:hypothetical protein TWF730_008744 [Orbilia blumenaviensis]|uniref:Uncharacterized protein n=1 Tax=Orbilia blumenaviensis TaxID=1796055 RepID=A0AAV9V394_9PEZI